MKTITLFLFTLLSFVSYSQEFILSNYNEEERKEAIEISHEIISILNSKKVDSLDKYLHREQTNFNGQMWLKKNDFKTFLSTDIINKTFFKDSIASFTFDEVISSEKKIEVYKKFRRTFKNDHILVSGKYLDLEDSATYALNIVLGKFNNLWTLISIHLSDVIIKNNISEDLQYNRIENIEELGLEIPIPDVFSERQIENNMIVFTYGEEKQIDAVIQIFSSEKRGPVEIQTYVWAAQYYIDNYFQASLLLNGIVYEYYWTDADGNRKKGITIGLEKENKVIIIQYFASSKTDSKMWIAIEKMMENLKI